MIDSLLRAAVLALSRPQAAGRPGLLVRARAAALRSTLRALLRQRHLGEVLDLLGSTKAAPMLPVDALRIADALRHTGASCLFRALGGYAALRAQGEEISFVLGVRATGEELVAHAWLERGGTPVGEPEDPRNHFTVALEHPAPRARPTAPGERASSPLAPNGDVILTELRDGTGVLLHLGTKFYYALNATGVAAWNALASGQAEDAGDVARAIGERFAGADPDAVRRDVETLLAELAEEGLLAKAASASPRGPAA